jgi:hypothetical protein
MTEGIDRVGSTISEARDAARRAGSEPPLIATLRRFVDHLAQPYHPERHYMRGPGPACRAKEDQPVPVSASGQTDAR